MDPNLSSILMGLLLYLGMTVAVVSAEEWGRRVLPDVWRWTTVGLLVGLIVFKLELMQPLVFTVVLVLLVGLLGLLKIVSPDGAAGPAAGLMWLLALSPSWSHILPSGVFLNVLVGAGSVLMMITVLRGLEALRSLRWFVGRTVRLIGVGTVLVVVVAVGFLWVSGTGAEEPGDYFTGTIPDVRLAGDREVEELPNIILISVDTLRADAVPPHADESLEVPTLRNLYEDSVRFSTMFSTTSWTLPSHASLFTGLLPVEHGAVKDRGTRIYASIPTYVQQLRRLGYRTGAFTGGGWLDPEFGFGRGFQTFWKNQKAHEGPSSVFRPGVLSLGVILSGTVEGGSECPPQRTERFLRQFCSNVQHAKRWIRDHEDGSRPFFLFLHTFRVHDYVKAYPRDVRRLRREHPGLARSLFQDRPQFDVFRRPLSETSTRIFRERLSGMDGNFRTIFQRLDRDQPSSSRALKHWVGILPSSSWARFRELSPDRQREILFRFAVVGRAVRERPVPLTLRRTSLPLVLSSPQDRLEDHLRILRERGGYSSRQIDTLRTLTGRQLAGRRHLYRYGLEAMDRDLGDFLEFLRSSNLYEDSVILFLSDHGEGFSRDPLMIAHHSREFLDHQGQLHDDLIRVPFWMKLPGSERRGETVPDPRQIFEVFPLLFQEMGITGYRPHQHPFGTDVGSDNLSLLGRRLMVSSVSEMHGSFRHTPQYAVRSVRHKLVHHWVRRVRRYRRLPDGRGAVERHVSAEQVPSHERTRLSEHLERLLKHHRSLPDPYRDRGFRQSPETRRELRGLGYMQ